MRPPACSATDGVHLHIARIGLPAGETVVLLENHKLEEI